MFRFSRATVTCAPRAVGFRVHSNVLSRPDLQKYGNILGGENFHPEALKTFQAWHDSVDTVVKSGGGGNPSELEDILKNRVHEKCTFHPPTYFKHWEGRDEMLLILYCVSEVFGKSFTYGRQWISPDGRDWALEFTAEIGETKKIITGIDLVKLNEDGRIVEFAVLARPPNAVTELKTAMMQKVPLRLAALKVKQGFSSLLGR